METAEHPADEPRRRNGCLRGFLIALAILIGLPVLTLLLVLFLTSPSQVQLARLESPTGAAADIGPAITGGGTVIDIPQSAVTAMIVPPIAAAMADVPEIRFLGADVRFDDEEVNILAGVEGRIPDTRIRRNAVLEIRTRLELDPEGWIALTPVRLKFGRLPLPVGRLARTVRRYQEGGYQSVSLEAPGVRIDHAGGRLLVDPQIFLDQLIPGMEVHSVRAVRGSLRVALRVPDTLSRSLENLILTTAADRETLLADLASALPPEAQDLADSVRDLFDSVEGAAAAEEPFEGATVSYVEGDVTADSRGSDGSLPVDIGDRLAAGTRILSGRDSWAELVLPPSHIVRVGADSEFVVVAASGNGKNTAISLDAGRIRLLVSRLAGGDEFRISTPDAVMAVRGTDFVVDRSLPSATQLSVLDGQVGIASPGGTGEVPVEADQTLTVKKGRMGVPVALDADLRSKITAELGIRTRPADVADLTASSVVNLAMPHVMMAAEIWAGLDEDTQWAVQDVIDGHMATHPEIGRALDEFFRVNGLEDRRGEFERMFE